MRLVIFRRVESHNKFNNKRGYASQFQYKKYRDEWFSWIMAAISTDRSGYKKPSVDDFPGGRRRVVIESYRSRLLDKGNLYAGCKPLLDALQHFKIIVNDNVKWIEEDCYQYQVPKQDEKTVITITPIENA